MPTDQIDYLSSGSLVFSVTPGLNKHAWALMLLDLQTGHLRHLMDYSSGTLAPQWSPDGRYLLCSFNRHCNGIRVYDLERDQLIRIDQGNEDYGECSAEWSPDGRFIAYMSTRDSWPTPYNLEVFEFVTGERRRLTHESGGRPRWSPDGEWIIYYAPNRDVRHYKIRPDGSEDQPFIELLIPQLRPRVPDWSPDGTRIAFSTWQVLEQNDPDFDRPASQIYTADANGQNIQLAAPDIWYWCAPIWSPRGDQIAVLGSHTLQYGSASIWIIENGTVREIVKQTYSDGEVWSMWSPDARYIAYAPMHGRTFEGRGISIVEVATGKVHEFVTDLMAAYPVWRPSF